MAKEIVNRVAKSALVTLDLETYFPEGKRVEIDLSQWLEGGFVLREKEFRTALKATDFHPITIAMSPCIVRPRQYFRAGQLYW